MPKRQIDTADVHSVTDARAYGTDYTIDKQNLTFPRAGTVSLEFFKKNGEPVGEDWDQSLRVNFAGAAPAYQLSASPCSIRWPIAGRTQGNLSVTWTKCEMPVDYNCRIYLETTGSDCCNII